MQVLGAVPVEHRAVTRMSEWTGVPKPLCFRVIAAARTGADPLEILDALPGVRGLERTLNAIAGRCESREVRTLALRSVQSYDELIGLLGGTQAKARRYVAAFMNVGAGTQDTNLGTRKAMFDSARGVTGVWSDTLSIVQCISPDLQAEHGRGITVVSGHVGLRAGHAHLPVTFLWQLSDKIGRGFQSLDADRPSGLNLYALLPEFSSDPFPRIITQGEEGFARDILDWDAGVDGTRRPIDVFVGIRANEKPQSDDIDAHAIVRVPTRRLCLDLLLPKSLGKNGPTSSGAYFLGFAGPVRGETAARWHDRLHDVPLLFDSLAESDEAAPPGFKRHDALIDHVIRSVSGERSAFRHLRWIVRFPIWGADYSFRVFDSAKSMKADPE